MYTGKYLSLERSVIIGKSRDYNNYCCLCRCLDSIIPLVSISEISSLYVASVVAQAAVAAQAGLNVPWSQTTRTGFSR